jgi:hypothetical protein
MERDTTILEARTGEFLIHEVMMMMKIRNYSANFLSRFPRLSALLTKIWFKIWLFFNPPTRSLRWHSHIHLSTSFLFVGCTRKPHSTAIADSWSLLSAGNTNEHTCDAVTAKLFSTRTNLKALEALLGQQLSYWQWTVGYTLPVKNLLRHPIGKSSCCEWQ